MNQWTAEIMLSGILKNVAIWQQKCCSVWSWRRTYCQVMGLCPYSLISQPWAPRTMLGCFFPQHGIKADVFFQPICPGSPRWLFWALGTTEKWFFSPIVTEKWQHPLTSLKFIHLHALDFELLKKELDGYEKAWGQPLRQRLGPQHRFWG